MKNKIKVFDIEYLRTAELEEDDLFYIFETNSLKYSLIYGMFEIAGYKFSHSEIDNIIIDYDWQYNYFWKYSVRNKFREILKDIYNNIYNLSDYAAYNKADEFLLFYGLTNEKMKKYNHIPTLYF